MLRQAVIITLALVCARPALSVNFFEHPGQWFRDFDQGRLKFQDGLADLLTFGHCGRERDRARAAEHRAVQLERLRAAEQVKAEKARGLIELIHTLENDRSGDRQVVKSIAEVARLVQLQKANIEEMVTLLVVSKAEKSAIAELVADQQEDLLKFIARFLATDPTHTKLRNLKTKVKRHIEQIRSFPEYDWQEEDIELLLTDSLENMHALVLGLRETAEIVNKNLIYQDKKIASLDGQLKTLLEKPKPPKKAKKAKVATPRTGGSGSQNRPGTDRGYKDKNGRWIKPH